MVAPLHAVVMSIPAQGHINALMNLAELLAMRGFFITFVTTEWTDQQLLKATSKDAVARDHEIQERGLKFRFLTIPDSLPPEHGRTTKIEEDIKSKEKVITCLPGKIPLIRPTDIVSFFREKYASDNLYNIFLYESRLQNIVDYVLVNTFEELEGG